MKKSFFYFALLYLFWFSFIITYNIWKNNKLNELLIIHNNILVIKDQLSEINDEIEFFFHNLEKIDKDLDVVGKLQPPFSNKLENILATLEQNIFKYGCYKCHDRKDAFLIKILKEKENINRVYSKLKDSLISTRLDKQTIINLFKLKNDLVNSIFALKSSFLSMENKIHLSFAKNFSKHQRIEVIIGLVSLISILYFLYIIYNKIIKDMSLLKKVVKNLEEDESFDDNALNFKNEDFKYLAQRFIDAWKKIKNNETQLKYQLEEIESMNEELQSSNQQLEMVTAELEEIKNNLEKKVQEKTALLEEAYNELERSEAIKSSFLQSISHEFKTPLTPLFGYLKLMKNRELGDLTPLQEQSLNIMLTCAEKIYNTVDDLILLTKLDVDKESFLFKDIDLTQVVRAVSIRVEREIEEKKLKLNLDLPNVPIIIRGEQLILIQIILHLIRNSIKYTPEGGMIIISLSIEDKFAVLRIKDTGEGIPDKVLNEINDYFNSKTRLLTKKGDVITVGLNILKKVSLLHECKVVYKSKKGEGTTVELHFPLKKYV